MRIIIDTQELDDIEQGIWFAVYGAAWVTGSGQWFKNNNDAKLVRAAQAAEEANKAVRGHRLFEKYEKLKLEAALDAKAEINAEAGEQL